MTAFVLACIMTGSTLFGFVMMKNKSMMLRSDDSYGMIETSYLASENFRSKIRDMYEQLCILGVCELSQCDDDMKYIGNKYLQSDFLYYMDFNNYKYKKTDSGVVPVSDMFDYYVAYRRPDNAEYELVTDEETTADETTVQQDISADGTDSKMVYVTNLPDDVIHEGMSEDDIISNLKNSKNYILRQNDVLSSDMTSSGMMLYYSYNSVDNGRLTNVGESYPNNFLPMGGWYYDNYGRYVYSFGNSEPIKFFAYPDNPEEGHRARWEWIENTVPEDVFWAEEQYRNFSDWWDAGDGYITYSGDITMQSDYKAFSGDTSGLTVFIAPKEGVLENYGKEYAAMVEQYNVTKTVTILLAILSGLMLLYIIAAAAVCGLCHEGENKWYDRIPLEVYCIALDAASLLTVVYSRNKGNSEITTMLLELTNSRTPGMIASYLCSICLATVMIAVCIHVINVIFSRRILRSMFIPKLTAAALNKYHSTEFYKVINAQSMGTKLKWRTITLMLTAVIAVFAMPLLYLEDLWSYEGLFILLLIFSGMLFVYTQVRNLFLAKDLSKLDRRIEALRHDKPFNETVSEGSDIKADIDMLDNISDTVREAVDDQIKSERMKIELVANVSHDLKTPLTSIISYIDLLKKTGLDDEAKAYVEILDKKSQKLKGIVADVFSLAKATSGIDVNMEKLDLVRLFNQSLADADDKIRASGKTVKVNVTEQTAPIFGDGNKLYRVFQNIIDNALKYSMDGSRIFLELKRVGDRIIFISKNISSYPIEFTADEITERFVRGDKSRTDGGSGLGLSIVKGFTEACGGRFRIELDGDMFKAMVSMPIAAENENKTEEKDNI